MMGEGAPRYNQCKRHTSCRLKTGGCRQNQQQGQADYYNYICILEGEI